MKNKKVGIVSFIVTVIFILTVCNLIFNIVKEYKNNSIAAPEKWSEISTKVLNLSEQIPLQNQSFLPNFINIFAGSENIASFSLENNGIKIYEFPPVPANETSPLLKTFTSKIETPSSNLTLKVSFYLISPEIIFNHARTAFFIILIGTLTIAILLLYLYLAEKDSESEIAAEDYLADDDATIVKENDSENVNIEEEAQNAILNEEIISEPAPEQNENIISAPSAQNTEVTAENTEINVTEQNYSNNKPNEISSEAEVNTKADEGNIFENQELSQDNNSLQSMQTEQNQVEQTGGQPSENTTALAEEQNNKSDETPLSKKLTSELIRSSSETKDLALFIMKFPGINFTNEIKASIYQVLVHHFEYEQMIFNFEDNGFAIIHEVENLDEALTTAEEFHNKVTEILQENNINTVPVIGISSKSLRILSADRLIAEAVQAVKHAEEDIESPIVAFRVNPDKYRKFMAEEN